ncbi:MAG: oligosaccharide flippase family protein [Elusimicrobia bacterium]|nr:oligosaccharide flippase family protein [Elusimicrobiota bacterium]
MGKIVKLGKETLIYGTSTVVARFLNVALVPFYTYFLATDEYGAVATVFSFLALFNVIYQYGMDQAYLRFTSEQGQDKKQSFSTAFLAVLCTSGIFSLIIYLTATLWARALGIGAQYAFLIQICCIILFLDSLTVIPFAKLRLQHRAWQYVITRTLSIAVNAGMTVYFLKFTSHGLAGVFHANTLASLTALILLSKVIFEDLRPAFSKELFKNMLRFAWPFLPSGLASVFVQVIDKPLLTYLAGLHAVGVYQANFKVGVFMMLIASMFDAAWRPFFLQHAKEDNAKQLFANVMSYYVAVALWVFLGLTFLMPVFIQTKILGYYFIAQDYWGGLNIIPYVLGGYLFYGIYINFMVAPVLTKKTKILMFATILGAVVSITTNVLLVPRIGITGAGVAILFSYMSMALTMFIFTLKVFPIPYDYKRILLLFLAAAAIMFLKNYFNGVAASIILLIIFPIIAFAALYKKDNAF